jgi:hypothetical protein
VEAYLLSDKLNLEDLTNALIDKLRATYLLWGVGSRELRLAVDRGDEKLERPVLRGLV